VPLKWGGVPLAGQDLLRFAPWRLKVEAVTTSIVATVSLIVKPSAIDAFWRDALPKLQAQTRGIPDVRSVRALRRQTLGPSTIVMFINVFGSRVVTDAYFAWAAKDRCHQAT
jgi:hypothetical protein